jgi:hypothetical protein
MAMERINPAEQLAATGTPSSTTFLRGDNTWNTPSGGSGSTTPTANTGAEWDANVNLASNNFLEQLTQTTTSAGTVTLNIGSHAIQYFTGTVTGQIVALPSTVTQAGVKYRIINNSSTAITVNASAGALVVSMAANTDCAFTALSTTPTTPALWEAQYGGTVTTVSAAGTLTLSGGNQCYVFSGTTATWTLPVLAGNTGSNLILENRGSGAVTVVAAGSDHIWFQSSITTFTIAAGGSIPLINDGAFWNTLALDLVHNSVGILPIANGGTDVGSVTIAPTATSFAGWDANSNLSANAFLGQLTTTPTASLPFSLTIASDPIQVLTGSTAGTLTLPTASVPVGAQWMVINQSTALVTVNPSGGAPSCVVLAAGTSATFTANAATPTAVAGWDTLYGGIAVTSGTVLTGPTVSGSILAPPTLPTTISSLVAINSTVTTGIKIASCQVPAGTAVAGSAFKVKAFGTNSTAVAGTVNYIIRVGSANTTADASITTVAAPVAATLGVGTYVDGLVTIRSTGAPGTCIASAVGIGSATAVSTSTTTVSITTTTALFVSLYAYATAGTHNIQQAFIGWAQG